MYRINVVTPSSIDGFFKLIFPVPFYECVYSDTFFYSPILFPISIHYFCLIYAEYMAYPVCSSLYVMLLYQKELLIIPCCIAQTAT